jgi:hypothetical protein
MASDQSAIAAGNEAFLQLDYDEALTKYSLAVANGVASARGKRGAVLLTMKKYDDAMCV